MRTLVLVLLVSCTRIPTYVSEECVGTADIHAADKVEEHVIACIDVGPKTNEWADTCLRSATAIYCSRELSVHYNDRTSVQCRLTPKGSAGHELCAASGWKE